MLNLKSHKLSRSLIAWLLPAIVIAPVMTAAQPAKAQITPTVQVTIDTGADDLRAGAVAYGQIRLRDGRTLPKVNLNGGTSWGNNSQRTIAMPAGVALDQLESLTIEHDGAPRNVFESYDNWNVNRIQVATPRICQPELQLANASGSPFFRFTGAQTFRDIPLNVSAAERDRTSNSLVVHLGTGGDDLRGGAIVYGTITLRDGRTLPTVNLNGGSGLAGGSSSRFAMPLPAGTRLGDIASLRLQHDGAPRNIFESYDNWNLDRVIVNSVPSCVEGKRLANVSGTPFVRFTGKKTFVTIPLSLP
jgi:hypothetical protein